MVIRRRLFACYFGLHLKGATCLARRRLPVSIANSIRERSVPSNRASPVTVNVVADGLTLRDNTNKGNDGGQVWVRKGDGGFGTEP